MHVDSDQEATELVVKSTTNPDCISDAVTIHPIVEPYHSGQGAESLCSIKDKIPEVLTSQSTVYVGVSALCLNQGLTTKNRK